MKKKWYWIIGVGIILIILVFGSYSYLLYKEGINVCREGVGIGTAVLIGRVLGGGGIDNCDLIGNDDLRCKYLCIEYAASNQKSEILCEKILQINYTSVPSRPFYDECLNMVGSEKGDENICKTIGDDNDRNECLLSVASTKKDQKICEQIPTSSTENIWVHDDCLYKIALIKRDSSICEGIYDGKKKSDCNIMIEQIYH